jgi:hypothetical protein
VLEYGPRAPCATLPGPSSRGRRVSAAEARAIEAVKLLRARGFKAVRLEDGVLEWAALGLRVEKPVG